MRQEKQFRVSLRLLKRSSLHDQICDPDLGYTIAASST
jgi:hypothetical protein